MINQPPEELKSIRPFVHRGNQMQKSDPVITYFCYYWAVRLALEKGLHNASPECTVFVSDLMAELEERKEQLWLDDMLEDDIASYAHIENFAFKVFNNGSKAVESGTATAKTSDTLQAAAVFFELTKIFLEDPEILKKIKYAKFHAARILKAIKDGADLNPPMRPSPVVEDVQDESFARSFDPPCDESVGTISQIISSPPEASMAPLPDTNMDIGVNFDPSPPLPPPPPPITDRDMDMTFSNLSSLSAQTSGAPPPLPAKQDLSPSAPDLHQPQPPSLLPMTMESSNPFLENPHTNINHSPFPSPSTPPSLPSAPAQQPSAPHIPQQQLPGSFIHSSAPQFSQGNSYTPPHPPAHRQQPYHQQPPPPAAPRKQLSPDDIAKAQKYAKWAISALDYEDVDNAVLQFRNGLAALGAL